MLIFVNREWIANDQAKLSVFDRGFLYGDGIFDTMAAINNKIFRLDAHLERFFKGAEYLGITPPYPKSKLGTLLFESMDKNHLREAILRLSLSRGTGPRGLSTRECDNPNLVIFCHPENPTSEDRIESGTHVILSNITRTPSTSINPLVKSANYLNAIMAIREAESKQAEEAFMLNTNSAVSEGSSSNIFWVKDQNLFTPSLDCGIMAGITRAAILEIAAQQQLPIHEGEFPAQDLFQADEIFYSNSSGPIITVKQLNEHQYQCPGPVTIKLRSGLLELIELETDTF